MTTKKKTTDVPMAPGSEVLRDRMQQMEAGDAGAEDPGEDADAWGDYAAEAIYDNEDWDDPRHEMSFDELLAHGPTLKVIRYQNQDPEKEKLEKLAQAPVFTGVEYLDLRRNFRAPGDAEMAELIASGALAHIRFLNLDSCYWAGNATLAAIGAGGMPKLEALDIGSSAVTDEGLGALADASKTPALRRVQGTFMDKLSDDAVDALAKARSGLVVAFARRSLRRG